jgi:hypothetical protein
LDRSGAGDGAKTESAEKPAATATREPAPSSLDALLGRGADEE